MLILILFKRNISGLCTIELISWRPKDFATRFYKWQNLTHNTWLNGVNQVLCVNLINKIMIAPKNIYLGASLGCVNLLSTHQKSSSGKFVPVFWHLSKKNLWMFIRNCHIRPPFLLKVPETNSPNLIVHFLSICRKSQRVWWFRLRLLCN